MQSNLSILKMKSILWAVMPIAAECGEVLWSGFFNSSSSVKEFDECVLTAMIETNLLLTKTQGHGPTKSETINGISTAMERRRITLDSRSRSRTQQTRVMTRGSESLL